MKNRPIFLAAALLLGCLLSLYTAGCDNESVPLEAEAEPETMKVTLTIPHQGQTNVPLTGLVVIHFSQEIDPLSITNLVSIVDENGQTPEMKTTVYGTSIVLEPAAILSERTLYAVTAKAGIADYSGHALKTDKTFTFTTSVLKPKAAETLSVTKVTPAPDEPCWDFQTFRVLFNEPVDRTTLEYGKTVKMVDLETMTLIPGNLFGRTNQIVFDPDDDLTAGKKYRLIVTQGLRDHNGSNLAEEYQADFTAVSTGNRTKLAMDKCPTVLEGDWFCTPLPDDSLFPMSTIIPLEINASYSRSVFLGESKVKIGGRLWSEFAESSVSPDHIPFVVRKGERLFGKGVTYYVGGVIPSGIDTGLVTITVLADSIGYMSGSEYVHGEKGLPASIIMTMDTVMTFESATPNALLPQPILGVTLVGQATVQEFKEPPNYEAMQIELVGFTEINLGWENIPVRMALQMVPPPTLSEQKKDTTPPEILSVSPVDMVTVPEDEIGDVVDTRSALDKVILYFSEPIDPDTLRENFRLDGPDGAVAGKFDLFHPKIFFIPNEPLAPNSDFTIVVNPGVKDLSGNEMTERHLYTFKTMTYQSSPVDPPIVMATVPGMISDGGLAKNFFPEAYFSQILDFDSLEYGENVAVYDVTNGKELVPCTRMDWNMYFDLVPDTDLIEGHTYQMVLTEGITNYDGVALDTDHDRVPGGPDIVVEFTATKYSSYSETVFFTQPYADTNVNGYIDGDEYPTKTNTMVMDSSLIKEPAYMMGYFPVNVHALTYGEDGEPRLGVSVVPGALQSGTNLPVSLFGKADDPGLLEMGRMTVEVQSGSSTDIVLDDQGLIGADIDIRMKFHVENSLIDSLLVHDMFLQIPGKTRYTKDGRIATIIDGDTIGGMQIPIMGIMEIPVHASLISVTVPTIASF